MLAVSFIEWRGQAEVYDLDLAVVIGQDYVPGLQITMNIALAMNAAHSRQELLEESSRSFPGQWAITYQVIEKFTSAECLEDLAIMYPLKQACSLMCDSRLIS